MCAAQGKLAKYGDPVDKYFSNEEMVGIRAESRSIDGL